jgi:hypothetical protein
MDNLVLELRAEVDRLKIELEALRCTLSGLVGHFDDRLAKERTRALRDYDPESRSEVRKIGDATRAA